MNFGVQLKPDGPWVGRVGATVYDGWAEVAFLLGAAHWGHGYGTEALDWLQHHLGSVHRVEEFWAAVTPGNERSTRLLRRRLHSHCAYEGRPLKSYEPGDDVFVLQ